MQMMQDDEGKKPTPASDGSAAVVDLISDLHDDLLLHVLSFMPDARDLVQTAAISRRWRHLWTRAPVLRFQNSTGYPRRVEENACFFDFIDAALARRVEPIDQLVIKIDDCYMKQTQQQQGPGISRLNHWLDWAIHHVVGSLDFRVFPLPWCRLMSREKRMAYMREHRLLLPDRSRAKEISLCLHSGALSLPSTATFHELTDLSLSHVSFLDDDGDRLSCLLSSSSCFPRLQKLRLLTIGIEKLQLKCGALEFLELDNLCELIRLDVDAPWLSALTVRELVPKQVDYCAFTINVLALKELRCYIDLDYYYRSELQYLMEMLERCTSVDRHTAEVYVHEDVEIEAVINNVETCLPQLPHVKDVNLVLSSGHTHNFVAAAARFVARCSHLRHLRLHIPDISVFVDRCKVKKQCCGCDLPERWLKDDNTIISLEHLREVEISGLYGRDCHDMTQLLLAAAPALRRMTVSCKQGSVPSLPATCTGSGPLLAMRMSGFMRMMSTCGFDRRVMRSAN